VLWVESSPGSGFPASGAKAQQASGFVVAAKAATHKSAAMVAEWGRSVKRRWSRKKKKVLTYSYMGMYCWGMARAATTSDAFNAVAEPRRRDILQFLATGERSVGEIVMRLGFEQPSVSKHLRVLLEVKLVEVRRDGRHMLYRANAEAIRPMHEWTSRFERLWKHQLLQVKERAEKKNAG
jgi:DNA-binding transcriptional ArsR family regulator